MKSQPDTYIQTKKRKNWLVRLAKLKQVKITGQFVLESELARLCGCDSVASARAEYLRIRDARRWAARGRSRKTQPAPQPQSRDGKATTGNQRAYLASVEFLQSFEWRQLRMKALKLHGARCQCCGASPQTGAVMNVDHVKPRKLFPELALSLDNLQVLCDECNHGKGNWDQTDWRPEEFDAEHVAHLRLIKNHG